MNIAAYIQGSVNASQRLRIEADTPPLREGYSRTQALLDHIAEAGPISTVDLCKALDLSSKQVWGMLKQPSFSGKVTHTHGVWSRTTQEANDWKASLDAAVMAQQEAEAVELLTSRGWTCVKAERE